jgi:hypothetical protein
MGIEWELQAMIAGLVGYQMAIFGTVISSGSTNNQPLIIIAFLCYTPAAFLIAAVKFADIGKHVVISILEIVLLFVAGKRCRLSCVFSFAPDRSLNLNCHLQSAL